MPGWKEPSARAVFVKKSRSPWRTTSGLASCAGAGTATRKNPSNPRPTLVSCFMAFMLPRLPEPCNEESVMPRQPIALGIILLLTTGTHAQEPITLGGHGGWVGAVAFAPDSR